MKVILSMAISANGIIATKEGSEDFLSDKNWLCFISRVKESGCFLYGRKTYESVVQWGDVYLKELDEVRKIVVSASSFEPKGGFILARSPEDALLILEKEGFESVVIAGGAILNSECIKKNLIDEVIFYINPILLGEGVPIFSPFNFVKKLHFLGFTPVDEDVFEVRYRIEK